MTPSGFAAALSALDMDAVVWRPAYEDAYRDLYRAYGLRVRQHRATPVLTWRGTGTVNLERDARTDMWSHEIAHYIVATPRERRLPEWGLGRSPFARDLPDENVRLPHTRSADTIEGRASILGIWIARYLEGFHNARCYYNEHQWDRATFREITEELLHRRLLVRPAPRRRIVSQCLLRHPAARDIWRTHG